MTSKKTKELRRKAKGGSIATDEELENYPELFMFFYDEIADVNDRKQGLSPLSKECYEKIFNRYENGEYPEHLRWLAEKELKLKLRER